MRAVLATAIGCCLLTLACDRARDKEIQTNDAESTPVADALTVESPETLNEHGLLDQPETQEEQLSDAERIQRKNQEMLAALAAKERSSQTSETLPVADLDAEADKRTASVSNSPETESPQVDLSRYEERLSKLVDKYEEFSTRLRKATTDCEPKRTTSSGIIRDSSTGQWVHTSESGWIEGSQAACAEVSELNNRMSQALHDYDRLYNDYTLEAMRLGVLLEVQRRQLPIPERR